MPFDLRENKEMNEKERFFHALPFFKMSLASLSYERRVFPSIYQNANNLMSQLLFL